MIGRAHNVGIVLHHENRVPQLAEFFENMDQPPGVTAVQPDRRLIQHVTRAYQSRAKAGGKLDALRFAARERRRQPVECQIVEPHVVQKLEALPDFHQDLVRDRVLFRGQLQRIKERLGFGDIHGPHMGQIFFADPNVQRLFPQACSIAFRAARVAAITG